VNLALAVAAVIVVAITLYAWSGLADFGAGFWDLTAGGPARGRRVRALIDEVVTPVWEANHVWLIFILITTWTAFGLAFGPIMTTLFVPLALAALGIVLRGANFALRKDAARAGARQWASWLFGIGAIMTPFFFGASVGAMLSARIPADGSGDPVTSWWNWTSIAVGVLAVAMSAFLAAAYLVVESSRRGLPELRDYFRRRALIVGIVALLCGVGAAFALHHDQLRMFHQLTHRSIPLLAVGLVALGATLFMASRGVARGMRIVAAAGVAALVWAWAVAQYPYLLPFDLTVSAGAGASITLKWILVWFGVAVVTVIPLLVLLYTLDQRGVLIEDPMTSVPDHGADADAGRRPGSRSPAGQDVPAASGAQRGPDTEGEAPVTGSDAAEPPAQPAPPAERRQSGAHRAPRRR
jgi:cytochrome bd ubiquinol oxidase subunit II